MNLLKLSSTATFGPRTCRSERWETEIKSMEENKTDLTQIIWRMRDREQREGATERDGA